MVGTLAIKPTRMTSRLLECLAQEFAWGERASALSKLLELFSIQVRVLRPSHSQDVAKYFSPQITSPRERRKDQGSKKKNQKKCKKKASTQKLDEEKKEST